jgi:uncharacterized membrane protein
MAKHERRTFFADFRHFFLRGLGILLPSVLTIWILVAAYRFVQSNIAEPINIGVRELVVRGTNLFPVEDPQIDETIAAFNEQKRAEYRAAGTSRDWVRREIRRAELNEWWSKRAFPMDLLGLAVAVVLIYMVGATLGSFFGRRLYRRAEGLVRKVPLIKHVYPSIKQVTDFFFGDGSEEQRLKFSRVVAVQYPRKGLWSVGLMTGDTLQLIQDAAGVPCITVFIPSSPTPFTGYVITVPKCDSIDLPITIDEALRFVISGGVIVPDSQRIAIVSGEARVIEEKPTPPQTDDAPKQVGPAPDGGDDLDDELIGSRRGGPG